MLPAIVQTLQIFAGIAWLGPAFVFLPGVLRTWTGRADAIDLMRGPIFFLAVLQVGFSARWLVWPHAIPVMERAELSAWAGLYTLSIMCAVGLLVANRFAERMR